MRAIALWLGGLDGRCGCCDRENYCRFAIRVVSPSRTLEENQSLFQHLSNILHLLDPKMYIRFNSIKGFLPESVVPTCGAWYACALNLGMTADGIQHQDWSDYYCGLNVTVG
jgi:hypothetical protein